MKLLLSHVLGIALLCSAAAGTARAQCAAGGLAVVVNKTNPIESLSVAQLRRLILGDIRTWPDKKAVVLVSRESSSNVFKCVLSSIVRMSDAEYNRYIVNAEFRGSEPIATRTVTSDADGAKIIPGLAGALMVVQTSELPAIAANVRVLRINGKEPGEAGYPF